MRASNFLFWLHPKNWLMGLLAVLFVLLAWAGSLIGWVKIWSSRLRPNRWALSLSLLTLALCLLLALSGCGTQPSQGKQTPPQVPAELMRSPGKPMLLVPSLPASTSTLPSPTKPPTPNPAEKTERLISASLTI
jgi:hypothetical protein